MPRVPPDPEHVVRAWELHCEGRSLRTIQEMLRMEGIEVSSHTTVRSWIAQGRTAAAWLQENEQAEHYTGPEYVRAKLATFLDELIAMGKDELKHEGSYEKVAPIMLRAAIEQARALGGYAALRIHHEGNGSPPAPDAGTQAVIDAMNGRHGQLLSDSEES